MTLNSPVNNQIYNNNKVTLGQTQMTGSNQDPMMQSQDVGNNRIRSQERQKSGVMIKNKNKRIKIDRKLVASHDFTGTSGVNQM